jgi:hypothetical protein
MFAEKIKEIINTLTITLRDAEKVDHGVKAAGIRVRKDALEVSKKLKEIRQQILELRGDDNEENE